MREEGNERAVDPEREVVSLADGFEAFGKCASLLAGETLGEVVEPTASARFETQELQLERAHPIHARRDGVERVERATRHHGVDADRNAGILQHDDCTLGRVGSAVPAHRLVDLRGPVPAHVHLRQPA